MTPITVPRRAQETEPTLAPDPRQSSADRLLLKQTHKVVDNSFKDRRRISDAIAEGFREMSTTLGESLDEDRKQDTDPGKPRGSDGR